MKTLATYAISALIGFVIFQQVQIRDMRNQISSLSQMKLEDEIDRAREYAKASAEAAGISWQIRSQIYDIKFKAEEMKELFQTIPEKLAAELDKMSPFNQIYVGPVIMPPESTLYGGNYVCMGCDYAVMIDGGQGTIKDTSVFMGMRDYH